MLRRKPKIFIFHRINEKAERNHIKLHMSIAIEDLNKLLTKIPNMLNNIKYGDIIRAFKHINRTILQDKIAIENIDNDPNRNNQDPMPTMNGYELAKKKERCSNLAEYYHYLRESKHCFSDSQFTIYLVKNASAKKTATLISDITSALQKLNIHGSKKAAADESLNEYFSARQDLFEDDYIAQADITDKHKAIQREDEFLISVKNFMTASPTKTSMRSAKNDAKITKEDEPEIKRRRYY
jgi:hypothetical protein